MQAYITSELSMSTTHFSLDSKTNWKIPITIDKIYNLRSQRLLHVIIVNVIVEICNANAMKVVNGKPDYHNADRDNIVMN